MMEQNKAVSSSKRMDWLDTTRGFAMLLVFWGHIASRSSLFKNAIYCFSAPLLFFMSGYLFRVRPNERFRDFAKKKIKSIVLPCTFLCIVIILFSMLWQRSTTPLSMVKLLFLQTRPSWPTWYMACLFILNLYMFLLVRVTDRFESKKRKIIIVAVNLTAVAAGLVFYSLPASKSLPWYDGIVCLPWNSDIALTALPFFSAAFYAAKNGWVDKASAAILAKTKNNVIFYELVCVVGLCVSAAIGLFSGKLCGMNWSLDMYYNDYSFVPLTYLSGLIGSFFVFLAFRPYSVGFLRTIGRHSVIYFAWHLQIFFPILKHFIDPLQIPQSWKDILLLVTTCLLAELVYQLLELTGTGRIFGVKESVQVDSEKIWEKPVTLLGTWSTTLRKAAIALLCTICIVGVGGFGLLKIYRHEHQMNDRLGEIRTASELIPEISETLKAPDPPVRLSMQEDFYRTVCDAVTKGYEIDALTALACGKDIRVLFVGDSISALEWSTEATKWLEYQYGINCETNNISLGGGTSYTGYARLNMLPEDEEAYDLAVICFGQNDATMDFALHYETVIRQLLEKNPNICLFSVLESSQRIYTEKIREIIRLADYYDIPVIDTLAAYEQSEYSYDALSPDTIHPGELGEELYLKAFTEVLSEKVAEVSTSVANYVSACATGEDPSLKNALPSHRHDVTTPDDTRVEDYSTFTYFPLDEFVRLSDTAYELRDVSVAGIPGIFYWVVPGANDLKIYLNDELIMECAEDYQHYNLQTRIELLGKNRIECNGTIRLEYESRMQADGFFGLIFSDASAPATAAA